MLHYLDFSKIVRKFAPQQKDKRMKEKKYPVIEEEDGMFKCCEPAVGYAATGSGYTNTIESSDDYGISDDWDSGIGPYTMEELNARIDEAEVFIEKAERGDWSDWVTNEEMDAELYREYPWLR